MPKAKEELASLLPSRHLWHPANGGYALSLAEDISLGGYLLSKKKPMMPEKWFERSELKEQTIEEKTAEAFIAARRSGASFSAQDMIDLSAVCRSGAAGAIKDTINDDATGAPFKDIYASEIGKQNALVPLFGRMNDSRPEANLTNGLTVGEGMLQTINGRRNLIETKLGTS